MKTFIKKFHHFIDIQEISKADIHVIFEAEVITSKSYPASAHILSWEMSRGFEQYMQHVNDYMQEPNNRNSVLNHLLDVEL